MAGTYYATTAEEKETTVLNFTVQNTDPHVKLAPKSEGKIIDVINDFSWTASPKLQSSTKVPVMYLQEREQVQNSLVSSAIYYLNAASQFDIGTKDGDTAAGLNEKIVSLLTKADELIGIGIDGYRQANFASNFIAKTRDYIATLNLGNDTALLQDRLKSYIGIYLTKPTGFNYVFPFYNQTPLGINSSWSSESQLLTNPIGGAVNAAQGAMERTAYMLNIMQPGTFIEKPKFYQYETTGDTVTVSFPLFNTIKRSDKIPYQQNYELLWILAFQNKPYRTSFSRISPPKLYTLTVPGQKYMPYCYISDMKIDFGGTRRNLPVSIPAPGTSSNFNTVQMSIPDVYMVSITFTSLLADVANRMVDSGFSSKKISVGTVAPTRAATAAPVVAPAAPAVATNTSLPVASSPAINIAAPAPNLSRSPALPADIPAAPILSFAGGVGAAALNDSIPQNRVRLGGGRGAVAPSPPNAELIAADRERAAFASEVSTNTDEFFRRQRDLEGARRLINDFTTLPSVNTAQQPNNSQPSRRRVEFVTRD
jgi:hypothetical protein